MPNRALQSTAACGPGAHAKFDASFVDVDGVGGHEAWDPVTPEIAEELRQSLGDTGGPVSIDVELRIASGRR